MINKVSITLVQSPIIEHSLKELGAKVTKRIEELNLSKQVATEDTVKTLKSTRAELNKESKEFEEKRKAIKEAVMTPYNDFENTYKLEIIDKYKEADNQLKETINDFEIKIKQEKRDNLILYFHELIETEQIDFVKFEDLKIDVNLSTSEKKYREQILEYITKVVDDLKLIDAEDHKVEILVEYKKTLNASASILSVKSRKQAEKEEAQRLIFERTQKRQQQLISMKLVSHSLTRTYNWVKDENIYVNMSDIDTLSDEDWRLKIMSLEELTKEEEKPQVLRAPSVSDPITKVEQPKEVKGDLIDVVFSVKGTFKQLTALSEFLKSNNYEYQQIQ